MITVLENVIAIANARSYFLQAADELSVDHLNIIPAGFNNNITWHLGHIVAVQQRICYGLSGLPYCIPKQLVKMYSGNTKPERFIGFDEIEILKYNVQFSLERLKKDLKQGTFKVFNSYTTLTGYTLNNIGDAIQFDFFHEQLHLKKILEIKSLIS